MGNINFRFKTNLKKNIVNYAKILQLLATDKKFSKENPVLEKAVTEYLICMNGSFEYSDLLIKNQDMIIIWSVHKLYPLIYRDEKNIDNKWLVKACIRQYIFAKKIYKVVNKIKTINIKRLIKTYRYFLKVCKKNPDKNIIPSLCENFVWHAHMQSPVEYLLDTQNILGFILNHNDDYSNELMNKYKKETEIIRKNDRYYSIRDEDDYLMILDNVFAIQNI